MEFIADSFPIPAALGAVDALVSRAVEQMTLEWGFHVDLIKLHYNLESIQGFLRDAEGTSVRLEINKEINKEWLKHLKSGISHAEKVLDELEYETVRRKFEVHNRMRNKVRDFFSLSNPLAFRLKVVPKLKHVNIQLDQICRRDNSIYLRPSDTPMFNNEEFWPTRPFVDESRVVGRDGDVSTVRDMLLGSSEYDLEDPNLPMRQYSLSAVAIVGTAGLGKTTLAQLIWKDESVRRYFDERMWICVSGEIKVVRLLNEMIGQLTAQRSETTNITGAVRRLQEMLKQKRCLLVLDDVWKTNANDWVDMRNCLREIYGSKGSKILVTARTTEVVPTRQIFPFITHNLDVLSDGDSWTMFTELAFAYRGPRETGALVEIGRRIVGCCKGSPFLISYAARELYFKEDEEYWESFAKNIETWLRTILEMLEPPSPIDDIHPREFRPTHPFVDDSRVMGMDEDVSTVRNMLLGPSEDYLSVVAILGMNGLGKTTLAQLIYNDVIVQDYFERKMWICVSGEIKVVRLLNEMIESLTGQRSETTNIAGAVGRLQEMLKQKRYLLVLDDVWKTNANDWVDMRNCLREIYGSKGSKILVTARTTEVVPTRQIFPFITHNLDVLSVDDSLTMFKKLAFANGGPRETDTLVEIGRRIIGCCKGSPLLISSAARELNFKEDEQDWELFAENIETWLRTTLERLEPPSPIDDIHPREFRPTHPFVDDSRVMGMDEDVSTVRNMLLGPSEDYLSVVAILGMDGLGKTTLAQLICKDETVRRNFEPIMWIGVPGEFKPERLLNEMIENLTGETSGIDNIEGAVIELEAKLGGKRYLLVIDDFFIIDATNWVRVRDCLLQIRCSRGSKILVTTRSMQVALTIGASESLMHELGKLSGGDSWTLFQNIAFADGGPSETQSLVEIGKRLAENCKGVPFVIKSLASLLSFKHDESEWMSMYYNESWSSLATEPELLERLRLTFDQLPMRLKLCFAYCAVFPKGHDIKKDELIQLWMSLGYLRSSWNDNLDMEDVGDEFYHSLLSNFLLEKGEMDDYKNITSCKMPDHVHDFAVHLYEGYHQTLEPSKRKYHTVVEHLLSDFWEENGIDIPKGNMKILTALFPKISAEVNRTLAFGVFGDDVEKLPNSVRKFKRLQYLDLSETSIKRLPSFITKLYYLHTLKLPLDLTDLPKEFHKLVSLRHWCMPDAEKSRKLMPMKIGKLECLRTLPFFVVGNVSGRGVEELGSLSKLRGRLHVYSLQHVKDKKAAEKAKISAKSKIQELGFHWDKAEVEDDTYTSNQEEVLEGLQPHSGIRGLILEKFSGRKFPSWMVDAVSLQNLVKIELRDCSRCEQVPSLGHLPFLEIIEMVEFENLKCIDPSFCGEFGTEFCSPDDRALAAKAFPALRKLTLDGMPGLQEWLFPDDTRCAVFFPRLEELNISGCRQLINNIPVHLFSIQELTISSLGLSNVESRKKHHRSLTIFSDSKHLDSVIENLLEESSKSLRTLTIRGLNELRYLPNISSDLASLEKLEISECSNLTFKIKGTSTFLFFGLRNLRQLSVRQCPMLTYLPVEQVKDTLVTLEIDTCRDLTAVELGSLTSLEELMIKGCRGLLSCWKDSPLKTTSLRRLETDAFSEKLEYFPTNDPVCTDDSQHSNRYGQPQPHASTSASVADAKQPRLFSLKDLSSLHLWGWEKLTCLPEGLQHRTTLTELSIHSFHSLEALPDWLANLSSLESLELHSCKNLAILPKQRLRLRQLTIVNCPLLAKRCGKQTGEEWAKIAHIPSVKFSFSAEEKKSETDYLTHGAIW